MKHMPRVYLHWNMEVYPIGMNGYGFLGREGARERERKREREGEREGGGREGERKGRRGRGKREARQII